MFIGKYRLDFQVKFIYDTYMLRLHFEIFRCSFNDGVEVPVKFPNEPDASLVNKKNSFIFDL